MTLRGYKANIFPRGESVTDRNAVLMSLVTAGTLSIDRLKRRR